RGVFAASAGGFDTAARCYEHAATLQPTFQPCVKAAEMFLKIRELNRAREYGIKAVELDPTNASGHLTLAQVFREAKQFKDAKRSLERVMKLDRSEEHTSELQSLTNLVCRLLLEKKKKQPHSQMTRYDS